MGASTQLPAATAAYLARNAMIRAVTLETLDRLTPEQLVIPETVEYEVLLDVHNAIEVQNAVRSKETKWRHITELLPFQIAEIMMRTYRIVCVACGGMAADEDQDILCLYCTDGPEQGVYTSSEVVFRRIIRSYNRAIRGEALKDVFLNLRDMAPRVLPCRQPHLIAVNNGVFDYDAKQLLPFSPDYVFLSKSHIDYRPSPVNPVIHNDADGTDWDVESWMAELSDDPEVIRVLWQILGAIIRPNVRWDKSAWFYSEKGNNGKGTLCELMRQLCGEGTYAVLSLADMGKDFMLEPLLHASAIIVDENDVGAFIDRAANLKAIITGDTILINRKYKQAIPYQFHGFMVQCLNEMPRVKDRSDSFFRRQLFIPFTKCFTGQERKYIKSDYLHRKDVLEYVLHKVLHMDYYELSEPKSCKLALEEYKEFNDPIRQFLSEIMPRVKWDFLPYNFLYDLYKGWYKENNGSTASLKGKASFLKDVRNLLPALCPAWEAPGPMRPGDRMDGAEPLIFEYQLTAWMDPRLKRPDDPYACCHPPVVPDVARGLSRKVRQQGSDDDQLNASLLVAELAEEEGCAG